jgi:hypothetical protein
VGRGLGLGSGAEALFVCGGHVGAEAPTPKDRRDYSPRFQLAGEEEERFLSAQPDPSQERRVRKNRAAAFGMTGGEVAEKAKKGAAGWVPTGRERRAEARRLQFGAGRMPFEAQGKPGPQGFEKNIGRGGDAAWVEPSVLLQGLKPFSFAAVMSELKLRPPKTGEIILRDFSWPGRKGRDSSLRSPTLRRSEG